MLENEVQRRKKMHDLKDGADIVQLIKREVPEVILHTGEELNFIYIISVCIW